MNNWRVFQTQKNYIVNPAYTDVVLNFRIFATLLEFFSVTNTKYFLKDWLEFPCVLPITHFLSSQAENVSDIACSEAF